MASGLKYLQALQVSSCRLDSELWQGHQLAAMPTIRIYDSLPATPLIFGLGNDLNVTAVAYTCESFSSKAIGP